MNTVNFQTRIPEELREQIRQVREQAGAYSDAETLNILVSNFINKQENLESVGQTDEAEPIKDNTPEKMNNADELPPDNTQNNENDNNIVIPVNQEQRNIISRCYNDKENLGVEVLKTLIQLAARYIKTREGFGIFDKYERYFITQGIEYDQFNKAFGPYFADIESETGNEL